MAVLRNKNRENFTVVSNKLLKNSLLNMKERGLLITLLSLPDRWEFSLAGICTLFPDGTDAVRSGIKSLQKKGYIRQYRERDGKGHLGETVWEVYEEPITLDITDVSQDCEEICDEEKNGIFPIVDNPILDKPKQDKPILESPILDTPKQGMPILEEPILEEPTLEEPTQLNINNNKRLNKSNTYSINHSDAQAGEAMDPCQQTELIERLKLNIQYDFRKAVEDERDFAMYEGLFEVLVEFIMYPPKNNVIRIANKESTYDSVLEKFMNLRYEHLDCARDKFNYLDLSKITSFKSYALTVLYNLADIPAKALEKAKKPLAGNYKKRGDYDFEMIEKLIVCN